MNATYADINNTAVLVEMAREEAGQVPEVSYGTHFFLDLVEAQIIYLPVYPGDPEAEFNREVFESASECSGRISCPIWSVSGISSASSTCRRRRAGSTPDVVADPQSQRAVCYLE